MELNTFCDFGKKVVFRCRKFSLKRQLFRIKYNNIRKWSALACVLKNTVKLAPDRFLTIFGVLYTVVLAVDADKVTSSGYAVAFVSLLLLTSLIITLLICQNDSKLYARILTDNVKTIYALYLLSSTVLSVMKKVMENEDERSHEVAKARQTFEVIELVKLELARRFKVNTREFCDHFLLFSPNIFAHRAIKAGFNERHRKKAGSSAETGYSESLTLETKEIKKWMTKVETRVERLKHTKININQLEALFKAESVSSSIQILAFILQNSELSETDLQLLFQVLMAYRGRSLFRRLMAVTVLQAQDVYDFDEPSRAEFKQRMRLLQIASQKEDPLQSKQISDDLKEIYKMDWFRVPTKLSSESRWIKSNCSEYILDRKRVYLDLWWEKTSAFVREQREAIAVQVRTEISNHSHLSSSNTLFIVIDKFSRAARTSLRTLPKTDHKVQIISLDSERGPNFLSSRLIHHVLNNENWLSREEQNDKKLDQKAREVISGTTDELARLINDGDAVLFISGASGIKDNNYVYTTSDPDISTRISKICGTSCQFKKIVLSGIHKLDWDKFYEFQKDKTSSSKVFDVLDDLGIDGSHIDGLRNTLARGVQELKIDTLILGVDNAEQNRFDAGKH